VEDIRPELEWPHARSAVQLKVGGSTVVGSVDLGIDRHLTSFDARRLPLYRFDVVVLGSGVAGSSVALAAADAGASVALVAKDRLGETNTYYAQGGVAAVLAPQDSFASHVADTLEVGCGLGEAATVERVVRGGPPRIQSLIDYGAHFDQRGDGSLDLSREGGHSESRVVHSGGAATGMEIQTTLQRAVETHANIACFPSAFALDLLTTPEGQVEGCLARTERGEPVIFGARELVLSTGGAGQVFRETTNPSIATGDGVAMALRAGAELRDMEFFQFHPTCLYIAGAARVLISEVVRGAGGVLRDRSGARFMPEFHKDAELAPRDIVSRACFQRMVATGDTSVYLDLSEVDGDPHRLFPGISRICRYFAIDIASDPIPVRPGAHYMIGGVKVDIEGRTSVRGLWAVGECSNSGMHGANRMGSNSLLEGLVLGHQVGELCAREAARSGARIEGPTRPVASPRPTPPSDVRLNLQDLTYSLKSLMWRQMGIEREGGAIEDAIEKISFWTRALSGLLLPEVRAWELLNMLTLARLAALGAKVREESRGTHYRSDFPDKDASWQAHTVFRPVLQAGPSGLVELLREPLATPVLAPG
jgi:L-aspartate oxidase